MAELNSALYTGSVMHHRFSPKRHRFIYKVFSLCIDLDELAALDKLKLFSVNRLNLFSLRESDYGKSDQNRSESLRQQITDLLIERGFQHATHRIQLLCYPRILGYAFNPLSVYFCYDSNDHLKVILYEVSNTFGQRHRYLLETGEEDPKCVRHGCDKRLYVSPFMPMNTRYHFRINPPKEQVAVCIRQTESTHPVTVNGDLSPSRPMLHATFTGKRRSLNDTALLKMFIQYPLMTLKVIGGIHWEALKLWRKGLSLQPRDNKQQNSISWQDKNGVLHHESL